MRSVRSGHYFLAPHYIINDLTAAVLLVQLEKVDGYIASKIRAAERIIEGLADIDELTPQAVRPGDRHTYWILGFSLDTEPPGLLGGRVCGRGARTEGVLLIKGPRTAWMRVCTRRRGCRAWAGAGRCMHDPLSGRSRLLRAQIASRWTMGGSRRWQYGPGACPNGEALMGRTVGFKMWPHLSDGDH